MSQQQGSSINEKFVEHLNELLSIENATVEHLQDRIRQTPIENYRTQLGNHLEETNEHQRRLRQIITNLGGTPTDSKGNLPSLTPATTSLAAKAVKDTVRDTIKSVAEAATGSGGTDDTAKMTSEEMELVKTRNDMIIEDAEVISYKLMIKTAEWLGKADDASIMSPLKQTLQEEERMAQWMMDNSTSMLDYHWSKIQAALTGKSEEEIRREKKKQPSSAATTA